MQNKTKKVYLSEKNIKEMKTLSCPSCGGEVKVRSIFSKSVVCAYCGQTSYLHVDKLEAKGGKGILADYGSLFSVGARGKLAEKSFEVIGRIRFAYTEGFWDEWALIIDDKDEQIFWLEEDEGRLTLFESNAVAPTNAPNYNKTKVGTEISFENHKIFVRAKSKGTLEGGEGELPFQVIKGAQADFIDGICKGKPVGFEFLEGEITFNEGEIISLTDVLFKTV